MRKGYVAVLFVIVMVAVVTFSFDASGQGHTTQVKLNINNTVNTIYIPGQGEISAGSLGFATFNNPDHFYLASYSGGYLTGLVAADGDLLEVSNTGTYHSLKIDQASEGKTLLIFSQGDWSNVQKEIEGFENGKFLKYPMPSFGFGLGGYYPLDVMLSYNDIDIDGTLGQSKGNIKIRIENKGVTDNKPVVEIGIS